MAVEAELCPQCGGSIQFPANQMQVICSFCGTTVDKPQPPAAREAVCPCPYCGSSILFAAYQMQVICPNCHTAVDRSQTPAEGAGRPALRRSELASANQAKLRRLVWDGKGSEAVLLLQRSILVSETEANRQVNGMVDSLMSRYGQPKPASNMALAVATGSVLVDGVGFGALGVAIVLAVFSPSARSVIVQFGGLGVVLVVLVLIWSIVSLGILVAAMPGIRRRTLVWRGKSTPGVIQNLVKLTSGHGSKGPTVVTRFQLGVTLPNQQPRSLDRVMEIPPDVAERLQPGNKIEIITNGPAFTYVTMPIKIVG